MNEFDDYAAIDAVNWSTLKHLRESALAYRHALSTPRTDTMALMLGRAAHTLMFEPEKFYREFAIWTEGDRRGAAWLDFKAENEGKTILKPAEIDDVSNMADAVRRHPLVQPYFNGAEFEKPLVWKDPVSGLQCKCRADWLIQASRTLLDFKSTRSIDGRRFGAEAARFGYHLQLAHYRNGVKHALGWAPERVLLVAAEKAAPHDVAVFEIDSDTMDIADVEVQDLLLRLAGLRAANEWPGKYSEEQALQLPAWVYGTDDEDDADGFGLSFGGE